MSNEVMMSRKVLFRTAQLSKAHSRSWKRLSQLLLFDGTFSHELYLVVCSSARSVGQKGTNLAQPRKLIIQAEF